MVEKVTTCLIGPGRGGKSSLLASWVECVKQRADGYSPLTNITVRTIDEAGFSSTKADARAPILSARRGKFVDLEDLFERPSKWMATDLLNTFEYFFRIVRTTASNPTDRRTVLLQVVDAAGEYTAPTGGSELNEGALKKFEDHLRETDAIIAVIPLVDFDVAQWRHDVEEKLLALIDEPGKLRRIVIAFTQYERLFVRFGTSAFQFAARRAVARYVIREYLARANWLRSLQRFEADGDRQVRFAVTSSYGFVRGHGNPNLDPHLGPNEPEQRFLPSDRSKGTIARDLWRPFLTADPFLYAALGEDSYFTFRFAALDDSALPRSGAGDAPPSGGDGSRAPGSKDSDTRPQRPPPRQDPDATERGIWGALRDYFA
jgi:hypothetical protein